MFRPPIITNIIQLNMKVNNVLLKTPAIKISKRQFGEQKK